LSKDIYIAENGVQRALNGVRKINTKLASGAANWIPEDETNTDQLTITENGEYVASASGLYGYSRVLVLVPGGGDAIVDGRTISVPAGGEGSSIEGTIDGVRVRITVVDGKLITEEIDEPEP
jgi:hypothetical protein